MLARKLARSLPSTRWIRLHDDRPGRLSQHFPRRFVAFRGENDPHLNREEFTKRPSISLHEVIQAKRALPEPLAPCLGSGQLAFDAFTLHLALLAIDAPCLG